MKLLLRLSCLFFALSLGSNLRAEQPSIGDIFDIQPGENFRGWHLDSSGIGDFGSSYSVFSKDDSYLVAITTPLVQNVRGGHEVEKITAVLVVQKSGNEVEMTGYCGFLDRTPAIVFYDASSKIARGFFAMEDRVELRRWLVDDAEQCSYGGD